MSAPALAMIAVTLLAQLGATVSSSSDVELFPLSQKALHFESGGALPGVRMLRGPEILVPAHTSQLGYNFEQLLGMKTYLTFKSKACGAIVESPPSSSSP